MNIEINNRRFGKTTEHKRQLGEQVYLACYEKGPRKFAVANRQGIFVVTITKKRPPKPKVEIVYGSSK